MGSNGIAPAGCVAHVCCRALCQVRQIYFDDKSHPVRSLSWADPSGCMLAQLNAALSQLLPKRGRLWMNFQLVVLLSREHASSRLEGEQRQTVCGDPTLLSSHSEHELNVGGGAEEASKPSQRCGRTAWQRVREDPGLDGRRHVYTIVLLQSKHLEVATVVRVLKRQQMLSLWALCCLV
jgi:hypothetical protein